MNKKTNNIVYSTLAYLIYVGFMVGLGFILNLFWRTDKTCEIIYWISTGVVCLAVLFYTILLLLNKKDKGVGSMQLFFTIFLSVMPILVRAINAIPVAGKYISIVILFIVTVLYLLSMVGMGYYANNIKNDNDKNNN